MFFFIGFRFNFNDAQNAIVLNNRMVVIFSCSNRNAANPNLFYFAFYLIHFSNVIWQKLWLKMWFYSSFIFFNSYFFGASMMMPHNTFPFWIILGGWMNECVYFNEFVMSKFLFWYLIFLQIFINISVIWQNSAKLSSLIQDNMSLR